MSPDLWRQVRGKLKVYPTVLIAGSVLTRVQYKYDEEGKMVGVIPKWIQEEAHQHGCNIVKADYEKDQYEVCPLTSTN